MRVFRRTGKQENKQITTYSEHKRGKPFGQQWQTARDRCCFRGFQLLPATSLIRPETDTQKGPQTRQKILQISTPGPQHDLNQAPAPASAPNKHTNTQTNKQPDKHTNKQTNKHTGKQAHKHTRLDAGAGAGCWVLCAGCWVLSAGCWVLGAGC